MSDKKIKKETTKPSFQKKGQPQNEPRAEELAAQKAKEESPVMVQAGAGDEITAQDAFLATAEQLKQMTEPIVKDETMRRGARTTKGKREKGNTPLAEKNNAERKQ